LIEQCWSENPAERPDFRVIINWLSAIHSEIAQRNRWKVTVNRVFFSLYFEGAVVAGGIDCSTKKCSNVGSLCCVRTGKTSQMFPELRRNVEERPQRGQHHPFITFVAIQVLTTTQAVYHIFMLWASEKGVVLQLG